MASQAELTSQNQPVLKAALLGHTCRSPMSFGRALVDSFWPDGAYGFQQGIQGLGDFVKAR